MAARARHNFDSITTGDLATEFSTVVGSGTPTVEAGGFNSTANRLRVDADGAYAQDTFDDQSTWTVGAAVQIVTPGADIPILSIMDGGVAQVTLFATADLFFSICRGDDVGDVIATAAGIKVEPGVWRFIEVGVVINASTGRAEVRFDEIARATATDVDTDPVASGFGDAVRFHGAAGVVLFDAVYVNDGTGVTGSKFEGADSYGGPVLEEGGGGGDPDDPLLLPGGSCAIPWESGTLGVNGVGAVLATEREQRHARLVFERVGGPRRVYSYRLSNATGEEVDLVRRAVAESRYGANYVLFRAPVDDANGDPAKQYRILNAGNSGEFSVSRKKGGAGAEISLELEEV